MNIAGPRLGYPRLPHRTARLRLTALVGGLFLVTGTALAAITYALFERATEYRTPSLPRIPRTPTIKNLQLPAPLGQADGDLAGQRLRSSDDMRAVAQRHEGDASGHSAGPYQPPGMNLHRRAPAIWLGAS